MNISLLGTDRCEPQDALTVPQSYNGVPNAATREAVKSGAAHTSGSARAGVELLSAQGSMPDKGLGNKHGRLPSPAPWTHGVSTAPPHTHCRHPGCKPAHIRACLKGVMGAELLPWAAPLTPWLPLP